MTLGNDKQQSYNQSETLAPQGARLQPAPSRMTLRSNVLNCHCRHGVDLQAMGLAATTVTHNKHALMPDNGSPEGGSAVLVQPKWIIRTVLQMVSFLPIGFLPIANLYSLAKHVILFQRSV